MLAIVFCFNMFFSQTIYAAEKIPNVFILENSSETIEIEGISYTYNYFYEDGKRVVTITNNTDIHIDKLVYDTTTSIMYLNGEIFWMPDDDMIQLQSGGMTADGWEILSTSSHYISWLQGTSVAVVAGAIAAFLGTLGTAGVIAAMGTAALSALAASTSGGTLYVELHMHSVPLVTPQYRFVWTFTASTGDSYGPFYYHYYM